MEPSTEILSRVEVIPGSVGRRRWPEERIVAETLEDGATAAGAARRYDLDANQLSGWRLLARDGRLGLPVADADVAFAPLVVRAEGSCDSGPVGEHLEVVLDEVATRRDAGGPDRRDRLCAECVGMIFPWDAPTSEEFSRQSSQTYYPLRDQQIDTLRSRSVDPANPDAFVLTERVPLFPATDGLDGFGLRVAGESPCNSNPRLRVLRYAPFK